MPLYYCVLVPMFALLAFGLILCCHGSATRPAPAKYRWYARRK